MTSEESKTSFVLESPFPKNIQTFDIDTSFPDFDLVIPGLDDPVHLHRASLAQASSTFVHLFKGEEVPCCTINEQKNRGEWKDERSANDEKYRGILLKMLRFCYGEDQTLTVDDCSLAIEIVSQLQIAGQNEIKEKIERLPKEIAQAQKDQETLVHDFLERHREIERGEPVKAEPGRYNFSERKILASLLAANAIPVKELVFSRLDETSHVAYSQYNDPHRSEYSNLIGEFLKTNTTVTSLKVESYDEESSGTVSIFKSLKTNSTLSVLDIRHLNTGDELMALGECLKENSSLTELNISESEVDRHYYGEKSLKEGLECNNSLTSLIASSCSLHFDFGECFGEKLKTNTSLTKLSLGSNPIGDRGSKSLCEGLKTNSTLTSLVLTSNRIDGDGWKAIGDMLKVNSTLKSLYLSSNRCRNYGALIGAALGENKGLTCLSLSKNELQDEGAIGVVQGLRTNSTLKSLFLHYNEIGHDTARVLSQSLRNNSALTELDLSFNYLGRTSTNMLSSALMVNKSLKILDLANNRIGNGEARVLSQALRVNKSLESVDLRGNPTGVDGVNALMSVLRTNKTLTKLETKVDPNAGCLIM